MSCKYGQTNKKNMRKGEAQNNFKLRCSITEANINIKEQSDDLKSQVCRLKKEN